MKKMVLKSAIEDAKSKTRAMKVIAGCEGVDSLAVDTENKTITVVGDADPVCLTRKLRKYGYIELLSVGPAEEDKKKPEKEKPKPEEEEKAAVAHPPVVCLAVPSHCYMYDVVAEENPNFCTIL